MRFSGPVAVGALALTAALARAEPPPGASPVSDAPDILVEGRTAEAVERFVEALTQNERGKQIARWNGQICPKVLGVASSQASYLVDRIATVARTLKISVGSAGCPGNIIVVMSDDADNFTRLLVKKYPRLFADSRGNLAPASEIARLLQPRPVRWISASSTVNSHGSPIIDGQNRIYSASRLALSTRENARLSFVIVDAGRLEGIIWSQLADYLTMVTLARPTMVSGYDSGTILSIFEVRDKGAQGPKRLTRQDKALLKALYSTDPAVNARAQRSSIIRQVEQAGASPGPD